MLRYFMMPKKNQRYANGQRWFYPVRCNYFLAEPASNIETIENNVKHTAPKPTKTREGINIPCRSAPFPQETMPGKGKTGR